MVWREEDHPRDDGGRFTNSEKYYPTNSLEPYRKHRTASPNTIKLPDEDIPRSVGAMWNKMARSNELKFIGMRNLLYAE